MGDRLGIPGAVSFFPIFFCNQQRVLLLLLHRRNILERAGKTHHHSKKKDMETNTHHHWGKRVTTPMTFDIQNTTLFMSHEHVTLKMSYLERRVTEQRVYSPSSKKQCMKPGRCLDVVSDGNYWKSEWFCSCNMMTKLPPELLFLGHEIKIKAKFQRSQSNNSMNDGGAFPCINKVLWLESFAYGHTTLNTPDLVRSRKLSGVGPG